MCSKRYGRKKPTFVRTLDRGTEMLEALIAEAVTDCTMLLSGEDVFTLHDTFGFPSELTREIASEGGVAVDTAGYEEHMNAQRNRARADAASKRATVTVSDLPSVRSEFTGYEGLSGSGTILAILVDGASVERVEAGANAQFILDRTSFYAEKGGQIGDRGEITIGDAAFNVTDTQAAHESVVHHGIVQRGAFRVGDRVDTLVFPEWRAEIRRHHTSAQIFCSMRCAKCLGPTSCRPVSWVGIDRMRFDFRSPGGALTRDQKKRVVQRVNELIRDDYHLETRELPAAEAAATGAIMMAG